MNFQRNNLDQSASPYLRQHQENPVWWQDWSDEVIAEAVMQNKPLFVSVGYATCHWCHVMAVQTFSDPATAELLNQSFICVKVDRELRPDIDQFMMQFLTEKIGNGGWPLNVFLTPDLRPIFAFTYATVDSLSSISMKIIDYYSHSAQLVPPFQAQSPAPQTAAQAELVSGLLNYQDAQFGGFGKNAKFPPHCSLLFLLFHLCAEPDENSKSVCEKTLDAMQLRGLNDHLQGGIFRYCVDRAWTIPHFEKMLYDQSMALWVYALAYRVIGKEDYKTMALQIIACLDESFLTEPATAELQPPNALKIESLYITAHDADTNHHEGATYLWSIEELHQCLAQTEFARLSEIYDLDPKGNFEGQIHLIRKNSDPLNDIEKKLLQIRRQRAQPMRDDKILCGLNALAAIALLQAGRSLEMPALEAKADRIVRQLLDLFWDGKSLCHSLTGGILQKNYFLFDAAAMLMALSMLNELNSSWQSEMESMVKAVESFRPDGKWLESQAEDFVAVEASWFDHPIPSSISLAETGLIRATFQTGRDVLPLAYVQPYQTDFYNIGVMISDGLFHVITHEKQVLWQNVPPNTILLRGSPETDCYEGVCRAI